MRSVLPPAPIANPQVVLAVLRAKVIYAQCLKVVTERECPVRA